MVGEIMEVSEAPSNVTYKIDDRTGPWIEVKRWMDEQVHAHCMYVCGWVGECVGAWMGECMDGWVDGCVGVWVRGWVSAWMGGWVCGCVDG